MKRKHNEVLTDDQKEKENYNGVISSKEEVAKRV